MFKLHVFQNKTLLFFNCITYLPDRTERGKLYTLVKKLLFKSKQKQKDEKGDILKQLMVTRDQDCLFDEGNY
jgi:hypothetical protein